MPDVLPALIALLGVIATTFVIRTRYRVKHSLYTSVRMTQTRQVEEARRRVLAAAAAAEGIRPPGETALELTFGLISLVAALGLVLMGVVLAIGAAR